MSNNVRYTSEQARAIETTDASVALSAGAGCGKTFVLTERFLSHLDVDSDRPGEPLDLGQLVAITFTERAAREMRDRIQAKCYQRLQAAQGPAASYWMDLLRSIDSARVATIHAFCATLLRTHAVEAGLDPRFTVLEQAAAQTVLAELTDDCLRRSLDEQDPLTLDLVAEFGIDSLRERVARLLEHQAEFETSDWTQRSTDELIEVWSQFHQRQVVPLVVEQLAQSTAAQILRQVATAAQVDSRAMQDRLATLQARLPALFSGQASADDLTAIQQAARIQGDGGAKSWADAEQRAEFQQAAKQLRESIGKAQRLIEFDPQAAQGAATRGLQLLQLAERIGHDYDREKRELTALDFNDLLRRARRLLTDPEQTALQRRLRRQIRVLLVDEFQDTDPGQVEIVRALCDSEELTGGKLFFVGDHKQSIYRFRGADPSVFRALREEIPERGRLPLSLNFRSQPAIIEFVNTLFAGPFGDGYQRLDAQRPQVTPRPAIEFLWAPVDGHRREKGAVEQMRRLEADWIARRLRAMLDEGHPVAEGDGTRPIRPGDVAILFRALSNVHHYEEALRRYDIDYYLVGGHAFYAQQEIFDLLNLLRSLLSESDEISLAGVLRSPFFSLSDETLYWLAQSEGGVAAGLFRERLPAALDEESRQRATQAAETIRQLRAMKDRLPVVQLIREALARTGYDAALLAEFLGERKLANLNKLIEQARAFDRSGLFGLDEFILQLSRFVAQQPQEPLAATHPESTDVVRLMTIHQSKGLEFPVVVVPDLERRAVGQTSKVEFHRELGPLVPDTEAQTPVGYDFFRLAANLEDQAERLRLFYVAATRAADYLMLCSGVFDLEHPEGEWTKTLAERFDLESGRLLGPVPENDLVPEILVTKEKPALASGATQKSARVDVQSLLAEVVKTPDGATPSECQTARPIPVDRSRRRQFSFSRLTGELEPTGVDREPRLASDDEVSQATVDPARLGSFVHAMLEKLDFQEPSDLSAIAGRLAPKYVESPEVAIPAAVALVEPFLASNRAQAVVQSQTCYREVEFLLAWPPSQSSVGDCYLQGVIDCVYQDAQNAWHVLDYKTHRVDASRVDEVSQRYRLQLMLYAMAVEETLGAAPAELTLHFLRGNLEVSFSWNRELREQAIAELSAAIAKLR